MVWAFITATIVKVLCQSRRSKRDVRTVWLSRLVWHWRHNSDCLDIDFAHGDLCHKASRSSLQWCHLRSSLGWRQWGKQDLKPPFRSLMISWDFMFYNVLYISFDFSIHRKCHSCVGLTSWPSQPLIDDRLLFVVAELQRIPRCRQPKKCRVLLNQTGLFCWHWWGVVALNIVYVGVKSVVCEKRLVLGPFWAGCKKLMSAYPNLQCLWNCSKICPCSGILKIASLRWTIVRRSDCVSLKIFETLAGEFNRIGDA